MEQKSQKIYKIQKSKHLLDLQKHKKGLLTSQNLLSQTLRLFAHCSPTGRHFWSRPGVEKGLGTSRQDDLNPFRWCLASWESDVSKQPLGQSLRNHLTWPSSCIDCYIHFRFTLHSGCMSLIVLNATKENSVEAMGGAILWPKKESRPESNVHFNGDPGILSDWVSTSHQQILCTNFSRNLRGDSCHEVSPASLELLQELKT